MDSKENHDVNTQSKPTETVVDKLDTSNMKSLLEHLKKVEGDNAQLQNQLKTALESNNKLSQRTREGMQSALDTLMKKWMDAVETKEEKVKDDFRCGLEELVKNAKEDNGVWQMMVSASALHERQTHNLDTLRAENLELRKKVDGMYANPDDRLAGKRPAETELSREDVEPDARGGDIWKDFAASIGSQF